MTPMLGTPPLLPPPLAPGELRAFERDLGALLAARRGDRHAAGRAARLAATANGLLACGQLGTPYRVTDVAAAVSAGAPRPFRRVLDEVAWPESRLRRALVAAAPLARVSALVVDLYEQASGDHAWDVLSVRAVGPGLSLPLNWVQVAADEHGTEVETRDAEALARLLGEVADAYMVVEPLSAAPIPPVIAPQSLFGESLIARTAVVSRVAEYVMGVEPAYTDLQPVLEPFETRDEHRSIADLFDDWIGTGAPEPRELRVDDNRRGREYAVMLAGEPVGYAIARPFVAARRQALLGERPNARAAELARLAAVIDRTSPAVAMGLAQFIHDDRRGFERAALLLSFLHARQVGLVADDLTALARLS